MTPSRQCTNLGVDLDLQVASDQVLTDPSVRTPDFFICGAAKAATTSLWNYLVQHPAIYAAPEKEPSYFSALHPLCPSPDQYARLYEHAPDDQLAGDASVAYLTSPDSAERIYRVVPDAKIIIMLRDPSKRAFSLYRHMVWHGFERAASFPEALQLEDERVDDLSFVRSNPEYYYNFLYFRSGLYSGQIRRYLQRFPREQIQFVLFDQFVQNTRACLRDVYEFLDVDTGFSPRLDVHNSGTRRDVYWPPFHFFLHRRLKPHLMRFGWTGRTIFSALMRLNRHVFKQKMEPSRRRTLRSAYAADIHETASLVNLPLVKSWLEGDQKVDSDS